MSLFPAAPTGLHAMENAQNSTNIEVKANKDDKITDENVYISDDFSESEVFANELLKKH